MFKIRGNRVLVEKPIFEKKDIIITDSVSKDIEEEQLKKYTRMSLVAVGDVPDLKIGDEVYIRPEGLLGGDVINIENRVFIAVAAQYVIGIYE
jgi:hypothetical protein